MAVPKIYNEETGKWETISYPAGADISAEAGNAIVKKSDGLYAPNESETTKKLNNSLTLMVSNGGQMRVTNFDGSEDKTVNLTIPADQDTKYSLGKSGTSLVFTETLTSGAKNINNVDLTDSNVAVGSNTLAEHLDTVPTFSVVGTPTVDAPSVNADLLEGHNAAYFANQSQISAITSDISALFGTPQIIIDDTNEYVSGEVYVLFTAPKRGMLYVAPVLRENAWGSLNINGIPYSKYYTVSRMRCPMTLPLNKDDVVTFVLGGGSAQEMFVSFR